MSETRKFEVVIEARLLEELMRDAPCSAPDALEMLIVSGLARSGAVRQSSELIRATRKVRVTQTA